MWLQWLFYWQSFRCKFWTWLLAQVHNITSCLFNILDSGIVAQVIKDVRKQKQQQKNKMSKVCLAANWLARATSTSTAWTSPLACWARWGNGDDDVCHYGWWWWWWWRIFYDRDRTKHAKRSCQRECLHNHLANPGPEAEHLQELHPRGCWRARHDPSHRRGLRCHRLQQWICSG